MTLVSFPSRIAAQAGLGDRFRYWSGASGRRYLFTRIDALQGEAGEEDAYPGAVALVEAQGRVLSVGPFAEVAAACARLGAEAKLFVHLLARRAEDRLAVIADIDGMGASRAA